MINILHTADWHLGDRKGPTENGINLRGLDTINAIKDIIEYAEEHRPEYILMSGDVIDKPDVFGKRALSDEIEAETLLSQLAEYTDCLVVIRGTPNHDGVEAFMALNEHFRKVDNVHIMTTPDVIHTDKLDIACLPGFDKGVFRAKYPDIPKELEAETFTMELNNIVSGLKVQCRAGVPSVLMAHYYVPGTDTGNSGSSFIQKFEPVLSPEVLNAANFNLVALGHIHRPQQLPNVNNCFYCGAVNRFTFNDEGFERGFYMHSVDESSGDVSSELIPLNAREFVTIKLDNDDLTAINAGFYDIAAPKWLGKIDNKIVRVRYTASAENHKALSHASLENRLYDDGAFYVQDALPENVYDEVDRKSMEKDTDPEANLIEYLTRKEYAQDDIDRLVELARPIMAKAMTDVTSSAMQGTFVPLSIEVKNYRNYAEESFDFSNITFCTINGENGAGKSSLFMDAIVDCLYEEPREGSNLSDNPPWIRSTDGVKSGSIIFTFMIGDKTFRVTRQRLKSGKLTLNLSECVDGEWENRSSEKSKETQKKILQILGMDSMTFKSCALIMQDQYGLFLQADKNVRMIVLSNLLGLGIYDTMSRIAKEKRKDIDELEKMTSKEIEVQEESIAVSGNPDSEILEKQQELDNKTGEFNSLKTDREKINLEIMNMEEAQKRCESLKASISSLEAKKLDTEKNRATQEDIIKSCRTFLDSEKEIMEKAAEYHKAEAKKNELQEAYTLHKAKQDEVVRANKNVSDIESKLTNERIRLDKEQNVLVAYENTENDELIIKKAEEYQLNKNKLDELQVTAFKYQEADKNYQNSLAAVDRVAKAIDNLNKMMESTRNYLGKDIAILSQDCGCIDIEKANCKFLEKARSAEITLKEEEEKYRTQLKTLEAEQAQRNTDCSNALAALNEIAFNPSEKNDIENICKELLPYVDKAEQVRKKSGEIALIKAAIDNMQSNISELEKRLAEANTESDRTYAEMQKYDSAFEEYSNAISEMSKLSTLWIEQEKQLPVIKERYNNALQRMNELAGQIVEFDNDLLGKRAELSQELMKTTDLYSKQTELGRMDAKILLLDSDINTIRMDIGALKQKIEDREMRKKQIAELYEKKMLYAKESVDYKALNESFAYTGIPHQIIRSILPTLTETANTILGQMTGGKMGVDFKTETINTHKQEKVVLDVLITEYGKGTLPYLSKSGGEKVKASLAVILALAEIKSNTAGMQLGMLFIDEPPFLDADGIQAYCDALITIQNRYPNLKVMAITHDPTMKARFPQNLDVIKTDNGSKVIY